MKNPLRAMMAHTGGAATAVADAGRHTATHARTMDDLLATVRRVAPDDNPFGIPLLDCREFASSLLSNSAEPIPAETAILTRERREVLPDGVVSLSCGLNYPMGTLVPEGPLFLAQTMQDKWHIFHYDNRLIFARSWTGDPLFVAEFTHTEPVLTVNRVHAYPGAYDGGSALAVGMVDFLIKSHLFRVAVPHPLPAELPEIPSLVATWSFNHYGRWGHFGAWADTTQLQLVSLQGRLVLRWSL